MIGRAQSDAQENLENQAHGTPEQEDDGAPTQLINQNHQVVNSTQKVNQVEETKKQETSIVNTQINVTMNTNNSNTAGENEQSTEAIGNKGNFNGQGGATTNWAGMLTKSKHVRKTKLHYKQPTMEEGKPIVHVSTREYETKAKEWESYLVGNFLDKQTSFAHIKEYLRRAWNPKGNFTMRKHGENFYLFKFDLEEDRQKVMDEEHIHISSKVFFIRPWQPFSESEIQEFQTMPIWVLLRRVPIEMWNVDGLSNIASVIGKPLYMDRKTEEKKRDLFARVCIEVKVDATYPETINLVVDNTRTIDIPVEYPWKPIRCTICKVFGHTNHSCSKNPHPKPSGPAINNKPRTRPIEDRRIEEIATSKPPIAPQEGEWEKPKERQTFRPKPSITSVPSNRLLIAAQNQNPKQANQAKSPTKTRPMEAINQVTTSQISKELKQQLNPPIQPKDPTMSNAKPPISTTAVQGSTEEQKARTTLGASGMAHYKQPKELKSESAKEMALRHKTNPATSFHQGTQGLIWVQLVNPYSVEVPISKFNSRKNRRLNQLN